MGRAQGQEHVLGPRVEWKQQELPAGPPRSKDDLSERREGGDVEVMPEQVEPRMQGDAVLPGEREGAIPRRGLPVRGQLAGRGPQLLAIPLDREGAGDERVVVLEELPVRHEDLPQVDDSFDLRPQVPCLGLRGHRDEVPALQEHEGALDRLARGDRARLPGPLRLDLRPHRDELVEDDHRRVMERKGREPVRATLPVPEAEPARAARIAKDRATREDVLDERLARLQDRAAPLVPDGPALRLEVRVDELPAVDAESTDVLLDLRGLQAEPVCDDEARPAAEPVRLEPREVPVAADLHVLRALAVDRNGTVPRDEGDLLVARHILEVLDLFVERDLLLEPLHLRSRRHVPPHAEVAPDDIGDQYAQRLARAAGGPDRSRVREVDVVRAVRVPLDPYVREPFQRRDEDPFREDCEAYAHRAIDCLLLRLRRPPRDLLRDEDRGLLPVVGGAELPDPPGDALDAPLGQELLDAGGEVLCLRDLHLKGGIEALPTCLGRDAVTVVGAGLEGREVAADLLGADRVRHMASHQKWGGRGRGCAGPVKGLPDAGGDRAAEPKVARLLSVRRRTRGRWRVRSRSRRFRTSGARSRGRRSRPS